MKWLFLAALAASGFSGGNNAQGAEMSAPTIYRGMCDASAAVAIGTNYFVVANDEDNVLRVYRRHPGALPVSSFDLTRFLSVKGKSIETDIEAATTVGRRIYWITSHGRNAKGKNSPDRHRFFATDVIVNDQGVQLIPAGHPYQRLLLDFATEPRLAPFGLVAASLHAPKEPGALNIEGLATMPDGALLLGFRNPIPGGQALLVPLLNPAELIAGGSARARFGDPLLVNLGGLGVRSVGYENGRYLIIAGAAGSGGVSQLYSWKGPSTGSGGAAATRVEGVSFVGLNPEGMAFQSENGQREYFILSDDGTLKMGGIDCKRLKNPTERRFRGYTVVF
jgi:hypothetical protein